MPFRFFTPAAAMEEATSKLTVELAAMVSFGSWAERAAPPLIQYKVGCPRYLICCGGVTKPTWRMHSRLPPLQSAQGRGTHSVGDGSEVKSLGHPPHPIQSGRQGYRLRGRIAEDGIWRERGSCRERHHWVRCTDH